MVRWSAITLFETTESPHDGSKLSWGPRFQLTGNWLELERNGRSEAEGAGLPHPVPNRD